LKRILVLFLLLACRRSSGPEERRTPAGEIWLAPQRLEAQHVRIDSVGVAVFATHLDLPGRIAFDELQVAHVFSPVSGRIVNIDATPGQRVDKGAPLVELESPDVGAAVADVGKARSDLAAAQRELERQRKLVAQHASAQKELDQAENAYERARAELARAEQRALLLRGSGVDAVTQRIVLRAPIAGEVIFRAANPGTDIAGQSAGGPSPELFTIGSLDPIWAQADIPEAQLAKIKVGAGVQVRVVAYGDRTFPGEVEWISGALDPATRMARLRCTLRNPKRELLPEMYATVSVATAGHEALAIPRSAVVPVGDERTVFVQTGTTETGQIKLQRRRVLIGESEGDLLAVRGGISPGDHIVVAGAADIHE
jgi:cobalt-zinc-cadmium efflux system membrane fusion protein